MNTNPIPEKLKERFRKIWRDSNANPEIAMHQAFQLAEGEKWISIEERLPDNGRDVLVGDSESDIVCTAWYSSFEECFNRQVAGMNITHWRELPTPPVK